MTREEAATFDGVPLTELFPELDAARHARVRAAVASFDVLRPAAHHTRWEWWREHVPRPEPQSRRGPIVLLSTEMMLGVYDDNFEVLLDIAWTSSGRQMSAGVCLRCWCRQDHGSHFAESFEADVPDAASLADAFESAAWQMRRWLGQPHSAAYWRAEMAVPG
ncbi:hypothetical protein [Yinghuangia soli]|uniref:Uncharacterized protein n=1 Tax=Yinghuangia soli TaxID=2908204 RepID=A0AA41PWC2_9ACTN|nr:hypothetical protein [Yinghuangia soli]MCF2527123.1 hypothetical protein [Yinghuangia soli]